MTKKRLTLDGAEEVQALKEIAQAEKLAHPTDDDEKIISNQLRDGPPSLIAVPVSLPSPSAARFLEVTLQHLLDYLGFQDVLSCRLVCRDVSEAVDRLLERNFEGVSRNGTQPTTKLPHPSPFINCRIHSSPTGPFIHEGLQLLDSSTLQQFLAKMQDHQQRNPFIGRSVRFGNYGDTTHNSDYWDKALELMSKFGHHIWHVELSDGHVLVADPLVCYKLLRQCLTHLPNLKALEISFSHEKVEEKQDELANYMNDNPMPALHFLEKLEWNDQKGSQVVQDFIVTAYSQQLQALAAPMSVVYIEITELTFLNLRILYLTNVANNESLIELRWCKLPSLKQLYLNLGGERCTSCGNLSNEIWNVKSLLQLVKQFQLEFLSLFFAPGGQLKGSRTLSVDQWKLDCLKYLEMQHCSDASYEFLKCFPNLKHVHFFDIHHPIFPERRQQQRNDGGSDQPKPSSGATDGSNVAVQSNIQMETQRVTNDALDIDKYLYQGKLYESNIWKIIPSLEMISFKCVWDRQGKTLIAVNEWYWREIYDRKNNGGYVTQVVSKMIGLVKSMFSFS